MDFGERDMAGASLPGGNSSAPSSIMTTSGEPSASLTHSRSSGGAEESLELPRVMAAIEFAPSLRFFLVDVEIQKSAASMPRKYPEGSAEWIGAEPRGAQGDLVMFVVTPLYALPVALIYLILWFRVTALRAENKISIGDGGDAALRLRIRQHGNCAEWSTFVLILMILAEGVGAAATFLHLSGGLLLVGRVAHPFGLKVDNAAHPLRYVGNGPNIIASLIAMTAIALNLRAF